MAGMLWVLATATIVQFLLGGVWYGPLFGGVWQRAMNTKLETSDSAHSNGLVAMIVGGAIALSVLQQAVAICDATTLGAGAAIGVIAAVFGLALDVPHACFEGRALSLIAVNFSYHLVSYAICGALFAVA